MITAEHVCTCDDCHAEPFADRCKWLDRTRELEQEIEDLKEEIIDLEANGPHDES